MWAVVRMALCVAVVVVVLAEEGGVVKGGVVREGGYLAKGFEPV